MGQLVYVLGKSGTGKSYSTRNFPKNKFGLVNVQGKILPFKGAGAIEIINTDRSEEIVEAIEKLAKKYKSIVVDDFQYVMANEFMRRSSERGFDKFTEIARHAWDIANAVRMLPNDVIVYVMCHTDTDDNGNEKIKTIGKLLDEKICLEGMSTIVLKTNVTDGVYTFLTQNNGRDTVKSPAGMFPSYAIENDLYYVDQKIRNYYEVGEFLTDEEIAEIDEEAKKVDFEPGKKKSRKSRAKKDSNNNSESMESGNTSSDGNDTSEEKPKRKRRSGADIKADNEKAMEEYDEKLQEVADGRENIPFEEAPEPPALTPEPKTRTRRRRSAETPVEESSPEETPAEETTTPRRRRRRSVEE